MESDDVLNYTTCWGLARWSLATCWVLRPLEQGRLRVEPIRSRVDMARALNCSRPEAS